jgi:uncharacterized protein
MIAAELPAADPPRIAALDLVRGVAVLGILLLNIVAFAMPHAAYSNPRAYGGWHGADLAAWAVNFVVFDGRMRGLFSFLFGASLLLVTQRAEARGESPAAVHFSRMAWLLVIGLAHLFLVWSGDILVQYALVGMAAYMARHLPAPRLLVLGTMLILLSAYMFATVPLSIVQLRCCIAGHDEALRQLTASYGVPSAAEIARDLALHRGSYAALTAERLRENAATPWSALIYYGPETLAYMLLGMAALGSGMLSGGWTRQRYARWLLASWGVTLPLYALLAVWLVATRFDMAAVATAILPAAALLRPAAIAGWICLVLLLARPGGWLALRLAAVGRMALSNYLVTSLICTTLFYGHGLGWYGTLSRWQLYPVVLGIWAVLLLSSKPWLDRFRLGPFEWLWRSLARRAPQPLSRSNVATASQ